MLIFLYGPDSYLREAKVREIVRGYRAKRSGLSIGTFDIGTERDPEGVLAEARAFARNISLFESAKLVILRISSYAAIAKDDAAWLRASREIEGLSLLLVADTTPPKALSFLVEAPAVVQEFEFLSGEDLRRHIVREAALRGMRFSDDEASRLRALHGSDLWAIATELDMLALADPGSRALPSRSPADFMRMIQALSRGVPREKIPALFRLTQDNDPAKAFNVLAAFLSGEKKRLMADYDVMIKRGTLDYETALLDFAIR